MSKETDYYLSCGIKTSWHDKTLKGYINDPEAKAVVEKYLSMASSALRNGEGIYLWGANGSGKSHLMNTSFLRLIDERYKVRVFSMDEIVDKFTSSWYSDEDKRELNDVLMNIDFLGIDEFGKNVDANGDPIRLPDLVKRIMESVIRFRVQMKKPLWFASNTDPKYVAVVFSEDIASLLREAVVPVSVRGKDFRKNIQTRLKDKYL